MIPISVQNKIKRTLIWTAVAWDVHIFGFLNKFKLETDWSMMKAYDDYVILSLNKCMYLSPIDQYFFDQLRKLEYF